MTALRSVLHQRLTRRARFLSWHKMATKRRKLSNLVVFLSFFLSHLICKLQCEHVCRVRRVNCDCGDILQRFMISMQKNPKNKLQVWCESPMLSIAFNFNRKKNIKMMLMWFLLEIFNWLFSSSFWQEVKIDFSFINIPSVSLFFLYFSFSQSLISDAVTDYYYQ